MTEQTVIIPMSCLVSISYGGYKMTSSTLVWDVSSGFLVGIICILLAKDLYMSLKGQNVEKDIITASLLGLVMLFGIGVYMIVWSAVNAPTAWLLLWHGEICWL